MNSTQIKNKAFGFGIPSVNAANKIPERGQSIQELMEEIDIGRVAAPTAPPGYLLIRVSAPILSENERQDFSLVIRYSINIQTDRPEFVQGQFSSERRFRDFEWLHDRLHEEFAGAIIPPLPEKNLSDRYQEVFIQARATALAKYLEKIAAHSELSTSKNFQVFLEGDEKTLEEAKKAAKDLAPPLHASLLEICSHSVTAVQCMLGIHKDTSSKSPTDEKILQMSKTVKELEVQMDNMANHASGLIRKSRDVGIVIGDFADCFDKLGQAEEGSLGELLKNISNATTEVAGIYREEAARENAIFESPLYEYIKTLREVSAALQAREQKKIAYLAAISDVKKKQEEFNSLSKSSVAGTEMKVSAAEQSVNLAIEKARQAKEVYEIVSARVIREVEKFQSEQAEDIRKLVVDYVTLQIEANKRINQQWQVLLPTVSSKNAAGSDNFIVQGLHSLLQGNVPGVKSPSSRSRETSTSANR